MVSKNKAILPPVPKTADREMSNFLRAVRENAEILGGKGRSDPLDRAITFRDWREANGSPELTNGTGINTGVPDVRFNDPKPFIPTGVEIFPTFERVLCRWDRVSSNWYAATEIFRLIVVEPVEVVEPEEGAEPEEPVFPQFVDATQVGTVMSPFFTDSIASGTTAVYWIRHINRDGEAGPVHDPDGTQVTTYRKPLDVLTEYSKEIYAGANYEWLRSDMSMMHAVNSAFQAGGLSEGSGLSQALANSENLSDLLAELSLQNSLDKQQSSYEFQAQFGKNYARLSGGVHAAVGSLEAYILRIEAMESSWEGIDQTINANIDTFELTLAGEAGAVAVAVRNHKVDYGGVEVTLQELSSASASEAEGYETQWGVKSAIGDLQGGVGFHNDGETTSFIVDANMFAVTNGTGDESTILPFVIADGAVHMATAMIDTAAIYNLISQNIIAEEIRAAVVIESPVINAGSITGTTINVNNNLIIDSAGRMFGKGVTILTDTNEVILAANGELDGAFIKNLTVDTLKISANAVTVQSFAETASVDIAGGGTGSLADVTHPHDGAFTSGSVIVSVTFEVLRTSTGGAPDNISLYVIVKDNDTGGNLTTEFINVGQAYDAQQTYFVPVQLFVASTTAAELLIETGGTSGGESFTLSAKVVVDSAKR